ncbi:hypothetical protein [Streptomyces flavidovirens]|uniref:Secreted protein n=1 Tax=Streptomyces flavidovirens TaxID=67298 RepID=A0ABW6RNX9_9ACTN
MAVKHSDALWAVRSAKSTAGLRIRYTVQWLWFPLLWMVWLIPYFLILCVYFVLFSVAMLWENDLPPLPGSGRRFRLRRRMWLNRARMNRERSTDIPWLEDQLRALFDGRKPVLMGRQSSGTLWRHRDGRVEIDDSYFRQMGPARAWQIAQEYGYAPAGDVTRDLPLWIVVQRNTGH